MQGRRDRNTLFRIFFYFIYVLSSLCFEYVASHTGQSTVRQTDMLCNELLIPEQIRMISEILPNTHTKICQKQIYICG